MREAAERNRRAVRGDYGMAEPSGLPPAPAKALWEGPLDAPPPGVTPLVEGTIPVTPSAIRGCRGG